MTTELGLSPPSLSMHLIWFRGEMSPRRCAWMLGTWPLVLFWKVVKLLRGGASLGESRSLSCEADSPAPFPVQPLRTHRIRHEQVPTAILPPRWTVSHGESFLSEVAAILVVRKQSNGACEHKGFSKINLTVHVYIHAVLPIKPGNIAHHGPSSVPPPPQPLCKARHLPASPGFLFLQHS